MLVLVLVLKDSLRTKMQSLSWSLSLKVWSLSLGVWSLSWSLNKSPWSCPCVQFYLKVNYRSAFSCTTSTCSLEGQVLVNITDVERSIWIILRLHFWSLVTDCGFVLRTALAQQNCEFSVSLCW